MLKRGITILLLLAVALSVLTAGCAAPNRALCRQACQKLYECGREDPAGNNITQVWLESCNTACEQADEINDGQAKCVNDHSCAEIPEACIQGAGL